MKKKTIIAIIAVCVIAIACILLYNYNKNKEFYLRIGQSNTESSMKEEDFYDPDTWIAKDKDNILKAIRFNTDHDVNDIELMSFQEEERTITMEVMGDDFSTYTLVYDKSNKYYTVTLE